jgi:hypothetical protein
MRDGEIAEERDVSGDLGFLTQFGVIPPLRLISDIIPEQPSQRRPRQ